MAMTPGLSAHRVSPSPYLTCLLVLAGAAFGYALSCVLGGPSSDEGFHAPQVWHYYVGGKEHFDNITMPSTYHYILAFIVRQIGYYHDYLLRFINLVIGLSLLPIFYQTLRQYFPVNAAIRTLQLFFAPLVFPYFFLIYTDIWALAAVSLCFYFCIKRYYLLTGLAGLGAVFVRQDTVIWVGLAYLLIVFEGITWARPLPIRNLLRNALVRGFLLLLLFAAFIAFVIRNGGVAIGDAAAHQMHQFNISNIYVFLICAWLLFLALCIQQLPRIWLLLRRPWMWFVLIAGFLVYMGTFSNPHGYNNTMFSFFLHNGLLYLMSEFVWVRIALYLPIAWMALTLCVMPYPEKRFYWLLLIIPISTISHPLIEPRYYFPAYLLINWLRPPMSLEAETTTLGAYIVLAAFIMYGTVTGWFFL